MMSGETENQPIPELENVKFNRLKIATKENPRTRSKKNTWVIFNGNIVDLSITQNANFQCAEQEIDEYIVIEVIAQDKKIATLGIKLTKQTAISDYLCSTKIEKNFDSTMKFKGLGRSLWEVGLRQIQQIADERGVAIIHTVLKHPRIDLTGEKWDEIFLPILKKHGYTKINTPGYDKGSEPKRWRKKYDPNEQKMAGS